MNRVSHATSREKLSKRSSAAGSRSMQMSVPAGPIRSATSRAWPPSPKVQSMAVSPGRGSSRSISSPARTGTCVRVMSRRMAKALRDLDDLAIQLLLIRLPAVSVPHLDVVEVADDHHVLLDARVVEQRLAEGHASGRVEVDVPRVAREVAREAAALLADRVEVPEEARGPLLERVWGPDRHAGLERLGENHSVGEGGAELRRHVEPLLGVQRVLELPAEGQLVLRLPCLIGRKFLGAAVPEWEEPRHRGPIKVATHYPTLAHSATHLPTFSVQSGRRRRAGRCEAARGAGLRAGGAVGRLPMQRDRSGADRPRARAI